MILYSAVLVTGTKFIYRIQWIHVKACAAALVASDACERARPYVTIACTPFDDLPRSSRRVNTPL